VPKAAATRKLAASTVDRVVDDIAAMGWPEGEILGSEADLLERYGVSRAVFREAVRLLEHLQVARMRQGPGGGLMVLPPTVDSVTDAVSVYLFYVGAELDEVFEARQLLEVLAVELAVERLGPAHLETMRAIVAAEQGGPTGKPRALHKAIAEASGNPARCCSTCPGRPRCRSGSPPTPARHTRRSSTRSHPATPSGRRAGCAST
jgi:DNA-binding FadR family transcriptional regulator